MWSFRGWTAVSSRRTSPVRDPACRFSSCRATQIECGLPTAIWSQACTCSKSRSPPRRSSRRRGRFSSTMISASAGANMRGLCVLLALVVATPVGAVSPIRTQHDQTRPLPDSASFIAQARAHLKTDRELLSHYTFHERQAEIHLTKLGKLTTGAVKVYELYPGLDPDDTYRRLIEIDGKPRDPAELDKEDRKHRERILEELRKREHESPADREKRLRREEKRRLETEAALDDLLRVYNFT